MHLNLLLERALKARETQDHMEKERRRAGWTSWNDMCIAAADREGWQQNIEALCATWHEEVKEIYCEKKNS